MCTPPCTPSSARPPFARRLQSGPEHAGGLKGSAGDTSQGVAFLLPHEPLGAVRMQQPAKCDLHGGDANAPGVGPHHGHPRDAIARFVLRMRAAGGAFAARKKGQSSVAPESEST
eukprot:374750-Prymnesium_polylepis.2